MAGKAPAKTTEEPQSETSSVLDVVVNDPRTDLVFMEDAIKMDELHLEKLDSFEDAVNLALQTFGSVPEAFELSDGFVQVDKATLVGKRMMILDTIWKNKLNSKKEIQGDAYVIVKAITVDNRKVVFSDGSQYGVFHQLAKYVARTGRKGGFGLANGLRRDEIPYEDPKTGEAKIGYGYSIDESGGNS